MKYPAAQKYLEEELWPTHTRWAWAWVGTRFTCGVRTSGRIEAENHVNKLFSGPKTMISTLVENLINRKKEQEEKTTLKVRSVST